MLGVLADDGRVIFSINIIQYLFFLGGGGVAYPFYVRGTEAVRACPCWAFVGDKYVSPPLLSPEAILLNMLLLLLCVHNAALTG